MNKTEISDNIDFIQRKIKSTAIRSARILNKIKLIAASKEASTYSVIDAIDAGLRRFGENKVQEAIKKIEEIGKYEKLEWHMIGPLQTNKAKLAVKYFDMIQTVDSVKLASAIDKEASKIKKIQKVLIQVNIGKEKSKSGVAEEDLNKLLIKIAPFKNIQVKGLMAIPPFYENKERTRTYFLKMQNLRSEVKTLGIKNIEMDELSMGMSYDFDVAIEEGATFIRVGSAIFGKRK